MIKDLLFCVMASLGGACVAWGLYLESFCEKESYINIEDFRSSKRKSHRGQKWVFWGVIGEIILGFALAAVDNFEIREANAKAIKNDPLNQPVFDIFAHALIRLKGHDFKQLPMTGEPWRMQMYSSVDSNRFLITVPQSDFGTLYSDSVTPHLLWEDHGYAVTFRPDYGWIGVEAEVDKGEETARPTAGQIISNIGVVEIVAPLISNNDEAVGGWVFLIINGSIRERFQICPQNAWPGGLRTNQVQPLGFTLFATNSNNTNPPPSIPGYNVKK